MDKQNIETKINQDQSAKSKRGKRNDNINSETCKNWANGYDKIFVKSQPITIERNPVLGGTTDCIFKMQMDQELIIADMPKKTALVVHIDGTTTFRGDRVTTKTNEGVMVEITKQENETMILKSYPHLIGCKFYHMCAVIFPDELDGTLKKIDKENEGIIKYCVGVNYKTMGKYITTATKYGVDAAMRLQELFDCLNDILAHPTDYIWDKTTLAYAWIKSKSDDFTYMPTLNLTENNAKMRRDHLIYCLKNHHTYYYWSEGDYQVDQLTPFLVSHNIQFNKREPIASIREKIIAYLQKNYPPQIEKSMLKLVEQQNAELRMQSIQAQMVLHALMAVGNKFSQQAGSSAAAQ